MRSEAAQPGTRPCRSSHMRIGCKVTVITSARKTGPMMSLMDRTPANAIVNAAAPNKSVTANGRARS